MIYCAYALLIGLVACQTCSGFFFNTCPKTDVTPDSCPVCDLSETDQILSNFYYKKLSAWLFKRSSFTENQETGRLERTIGFSVASDQLDAIEDPTDLRELDAVITAILTKASHKSCESNQTSFQGLVGNIFGDFFKIFEFLWSSSEYRFGLFVVCCALSIWGIHKRYKKNLIVVILVTFFISGYFITYLECNRKLEVEPIISLIKENAPQGYFGKLFASLLPMSHQDRQIKNIQKGTKLDFPFCRPDHVLMIYINDMFLHQLQLLVEKYVDIIAQFNAKLPWFYASIAIIAFPILLYFVMKLVFEHVISPVAWFRTWRETQGYNQQSQGISQEGEHSNADRISGSNLKALLEIMLHLKSKESSIPPSGVEQIKEDAETPEDLDESCCEKTDKEKDLIAIDDIQENT